MSRRETGTLLLVVLFLLPAVAGATGCADRRSASELSFAVSFTDAVSSEPLDGRLLIMISTDATKEPRFQIVDGPQTQQIFGIDVEGLAPGAEAIVDGGVLGYPRESLADVPPGSYRVQALLHVYETFHRSDGHVVKLPMDRGEGQQWNKAPGNLYSEPIEMTIDPGKRETLRIVLHRAIEPVDEVTDTKYVRYERIQSELLTEFWGRPIHLGAKVLVPEGFDDHPEARYPLVIFHGHFSPTFWGFREEPPDPDLEPEYSERFDLPAYNRTQQEYAHQFYKDWTGPDFARMLVIEVQHANPYYDDSYAVNSANLGPYGDAIMSELVPYIEEKYRAIGEGWARFTYGGSTGGWEALAVQMFYPDELNGAFAACPDPIDFRAYMTVNIYEDTNAYYVDSYWKRTPRPGHRDYLGHLSATLEEMNLRELVLGTRGRSGQQWDIWQAVYSPIGPDGYPRPIWDKRTGVIDREVAEYWRENYDLSHILQRDWEKGLGRKLEGKIHIYVGDMDNYYLNNAVYLGEEFLENTRNPYYGGEVDYGDRAEHCWNGDQTRPNALSRLRYVQMFAPEIVDRVLETAPDGADLTGWRY